MKYQKIITGASLVGLITFLLPVVSSREFSLAPISQQVVRYLGGSSVSILFMVWYGAFTITLLISIFGNRTRPLVNAITSTIIILLSGYSIYIQSSITSALLGSGTESSLGFGGILYYLCAVANIFAAIMIVKDNSTKVQKEALIKATETGLAVGKATVSVATKVAKTAVTEVKKEINSHKSDSEIDNHKSGSESDKHKSDSE